MNRGARTRILPDSDDPTWRPLIDLYTRVFAEGQRETEQAILRNLVTRRARKVGGHLVIAAEAEVGCIGGIIFSYLPTINCGYASYVFVEPRLRDRGIGTALLAAMQRSLGTEAARVGHRRVRGLFAEIQRGDHRRGSLRQRFRFWERAGVVPLDLDWRYPALHEGQPPVPMYLAFGRYGRSSTDWYPGDLEVVARAIFEATYSYLPSAPATLAIILDGLHRLRRDAPVQYVRPWRMAANPRLGRMSPRGPGRGKAR